MDQSVKDQQLARVLGSNGWTSMYGHDGRWTLSDGKETMEGRFGESLQSVFDRWQKEGEGFGEKWFDGQRIDSSNFDAMQIRIRERKWDLRWLARAKELASFSKDPSTQVGAVIVDSVLQRVVSEGYNGFPRRICDTPAALTDRDRKLPRIVHAEMNAILGMMGHQLAMAVQGLTLYTWPPGFGGPTCDNCAKHAISVMGIDRVVWAGGPLDERATRWGPSIKTALDMYSEAGIALCEVPESAVRAAGLIP